MWCGRRAAELLTLIFLIFICVIIGVIIVVLECFFFFEIVWLFVLRGGAGI